jgi:hypothetical protein
MLRSIHPTQEVVENMQDNITLGPIDIRHNVFDEVTKMVMVDAIHGGLDMQDPDTLAAIVRGMEDALDFFKNFNTPEGK